MRHKLTYSIFTLLLFFFTSMSSGISAGTHGLTDSTLVSADGPIWHRGMVCDKAKYNPIPSDTLSRILKRYDAKRIIVGHTIFEDVSTFYDKRVVDVNVNNEKNHENEKII